MRITTVTGPWLPVPALQGGAMPRVWQGLAEQFAARGHEVTILARAYRGQPRSEILNGVRYERRGGLSQGGRIYVDLAKDFFYATQTTLSLPYADILVTNDFWLPALSQWARPNAGKIVVNVNRYPKGQFFLYSRAARFATASNLIKEALIRQIPSIARRIKIFPNPIDTTLFSPPKTPRPDRENKTILFVGRVHPEKGVHLLIAAFQIMAKDWPRIRLKIVGPTREGQGGGGRAYFERIKSAAEGLPVEFTGPIFEPEALARMYHDADLFCYPSIAEKGESFGVAPLEAMATGLVPVVSSLDCFRDFIDDRKNGYYFNHRVSDPAQSLSKALQRAIRKWDRTSRMSAAAISRAVNFSFARVASQYLEDFEELLSVRDQRPLDSAELGKWNISAWHKIFR